LPDTLLTTKLFIPTTRPELVPRPRLIERLDEGLHRKLTIISAPAGFGKTTLVSEWIDTFRLDTPKENQIVNKVAWLSLDEGDNDPARFLSYFIAAINQIEGIDATFGKGALSMLQSPQPPPTITILTSLINEIAAITIRIILVLDDYHLIDAQPIHDALSFLLENIPSQVHLVITTREDPPLSQARLRSRDQLTELRARDLRFTSSETAEFLNHVMGLQLSAEDIAALETRTEGWIAGLQLAAISLQGEEAPTKFIKSFTGSHRLVLDYLIEEVLEQQPENIQTFLLQTAILDRFNSSLCDSLTGQDNGQAILETLERNNLFIVPLDNERHWYRYHHLFADLLRQRLTQRQPDVIDDLHIRASTWYEENGFEIEAFQHAAAAKDVERVERLIEGDGVPLQYRGAAAPVLKWLASQPMTVLDTSPSLWVTYASALNLTGQPADAEKKLEAAESALASTAALQGAETDDKTNDIVGHIAAIRAMIAVGQNQGEIIITQSRRALEYLHPDNLPIRTITTWTLGRAYHLLGDRDAANQAYTEVLFTSQASGDIISALAATTGLGSIWESKNQLFLAAESYRRGLELFGDRPQPVACETCLSLAGILYEWNDLIAAEQRVQQSIQLARQVPSLDTFAVCGVLLARLKLNDGDAAGAAAMLAQADQFMRQHNFLDRMSEVVAVQVLVLLHQGDLVAATHLAEKHDHPISRARVHLAQGDTSTALAVLDPLRQQVEAKGWENERLKVIILQAVALYAHGEKGEAVQLLGDALALAEPGGFIRIFVDEGSPMRQLLYEVASRGIMPEYTSKLLAVFESEKPGESSTPFQPLIEPLSPRELEVLQLVAEGLSNREISKELFLSVDTVKGHNRKIFGKLGVKTRAQAVHKATLLKIISHP